MAGPDGAVICEYNIYNPLGDVVAAPSTSTIRKGGTTLWSYAGQNAASGPPAEETLRRFEELRV